MPASSKPRKKQSGNPAKKPTSVKSWKKDSGEDLELPSGNVALVKRPGPQALLSEGILPDTLMPIVQQAIAKGKGMKMTDLNLEDANVIRDMMDAIDKLTVFVVIEPPVRYHRQLVTPAADAGVTRGSAYEEWVTIPEEDRDNEEFLYTDKVDIDDKMFIFQFAVGGTRDLERFRSEQSAGLGDISDGSGDESSPE